MKLAHISMLLAICSLGASTWFAIVSRRAIRRSWNNLLWSELRSGAWERPSWNAWMRDTGAAAMSPADLELLKLAAQAGGIPLHVWGSPGAENITRTDTNERWNPLDDDRDAFRLQVAVGMIVNAPKAPSAKFGGHVEVRFFDRVIEEPCKDWSVEARCAATRRAIVRCAYEVMSGSPA